MLQGLGFDAPAAVDAVQAPWVLGSKNALCAWNEAPFQRGRWSAVWPVSGSHDETFRILAGLIRTRAHEVTMLEASRPRLESLGFACGESHAACCLALGLWFLTQGAEDGVPATAQHRLYRFSACKTIKR